MAADKDASAAPLVEAMLPRTTIPLSVLFVCLGNICRSTMAEAVFRSTISTLEPAKTYTIPLDSIDSAGTGAYHVHSPPDPRTMDVLAAHSITTYMHSARKVRLQDFEDFDYIFAMDAENLEDLMDLRNKLVKTRGKRTRRSAQNPEDSTSTTHPMTTSSVLAAKHLRRTNFGKASDGHANVMMFGAFGGKNPEEEIGDPYYGGIHGFEISFEQVQRFSNGFLAWLDTATAVA